MGLRAYLSVRISLLSLVFWCNKNSEEVERGTYLCYSSYFEFAVRLDYMNGVHYDDLVFFCYCFMCYKFYITNKIN